MDFSVFCAIDADRNPFISSIKSNSKASFTYCTHSALLEAFALLKAVDELPSICCAQPRKPPQRDSSTHVFVNIIICDYHLRVASFLLICVRAANNRNGIYFEEVRYSNYWIQCAINHSCILCFGVLVGTVSDFTMMEDILLGCSVVQSYHGLLYQSMLSYNLPNMFGPPINSLFPKKLHQLRQSKMRFLCDGVY